MNALPNPFLNPDALPPYASEAAASSAPQSGAAATNSSSCGGENAHQSRERCADNRPAFSEAVEVASDPHEAIPSNEGRPSEAPAPDAPNPHNGAGALDELQELLAYAHKRHRAFVPDEEAILAVAYDESALRAPDCDAVWRDEAPLFLRQAG